MRYTILSVYFELGSKGREREKRRVREKREGGLVEKRKSRVKGLSVSLNVNESAGNNGSCPTSALRNHLPSHGWKVYRCQYSVALIA